MSARLLHDKTALVTGAARGIGRAVAKRFAADGARVVLADIDDRAGEEVVKEIGAAGGIALFQHCDVGESLDVRNLLCVALERYAHIDILVSNAAVSLSADFLEVGEEDFSRVLRVNLHGVFLVGQAVARQMVRQIEEEQRPPGSIINMSSINAVVSLPDQVPYTVSKGGINQLTKSMALSLAPYGIRVNAIGPGSIDTDMLRAVNADAGAMSRLLSRTPLGRVGTVEEIAGIASFLAGPDAGYISGEIIYADGGRLALNYTVPVGG